MTDEHSESIFDFASKKPVRPPPKKREAPPKPPTVPPSMETPDIPHSPPLSRDVDQLIQSVVQKREELNRQLDETYRRSGQTRDTVTEYLTDPRNFPETTWKIVQQQREEFNRKVSTLGIHSITTVRQAKKVHEDKKRKGKTLGARRNWLSM